MKKSLIAGLAAVGSLMLFGVRKRQSRGSTVRQQTNAPLTATDRAAHRCMTNLIVPVWIAAGLLDYISHRRTKIETTSGTRESLLHLIMLAEGGPVVLAPLLLEVNAGVLALMYAAYFAHQATAMWDVDSTVLERVIPPEEQHIHAYLEGVPFCIAVLYSTLHWNQFLALIGVKGSEAPRFDLRLKQPRMTLRDGALIAAAVNALDVLPHVEEYWRCWKAERQGLRGKDTPPCAPALFAAS